jgi:hypothetical protein
MFNTQYHTHIHIKESWQKGSSVKNICLASQTEREREREEKKKERKRERERWEGA